MGNTMDARIEALYTSTRTQREKAVLKTDKDFYRRELLSGTSKICYKKLPTDSERKKHPGIKEQDFQ